MAALKDLKGGVKSNREMIVWGMGGVIFALFTVAIALVFGR